MDFCKWTETLWDVYFSPDETQQQRLVQELAADCSIIGTGADELYAVAEEFLHSLGSEMTGRQDLRFHVQEFWCRERMLGPAAALTWGGFQVSGLSETQEILVEMDTRFSFVFQELDGRWYLVHLHHSVPNPEQQSGEFYPRTLIARVEEAETVAARMKKLAQRDGLTGLINFRTFRQRWQPEDGGWLFMLDLDDFKLVNDTCGHVAGNRVLMAVATLLRQTVRSEDLVCRMGGDEFLVYCPSLSGRQPAERFARRLLSSAGGIPDGPRPVTFSIGGTAVRPGEPLEQAIDRADQALYTVKRTAKNGFRLI